MKSKKLMLATTYGYDWNNSPALPADATKYLDGTGAFSVPAGGGGATTVAALTTAVAGLPTTQPSGSGTLWLNGGVVVLS